MFVFGGVVVVLDLKLGRTGFVVCWGCFGLRSFDLRGFLLVVFFERLLGLGRSSCIVLRRREGGLEDEVRWGVSRGLFLTYFF